MRTALAMAIAFVAASALPANAAGGNGPAQEREIVALLNRAVAQVYEAAPHCRPANPLKRESTLTDADPSAEMLNAFAILRRPGTPEEADLVHAEPGVPAQGIYRRYVRLATSASGRRLVVYAAQNVRFYRPRPARCIRAFRRDFGRLVENKPRAFKRKARRALDQVIHDEWAGKAQSPQEGLFMFSRGPQGSAGGGGATLAEVKARGMWGAGSFGDHEPVLSGLLPDGVASITAHFGTTARPDPFTHKHRRHYRPLAITAKVQDNVVAFAVARSVPDAFPTSIAWYAADGTKLKTVRFP